MIIILFSHSRFGRAMECKVASREGGMRESHHNPHFSAEIIFVCGRACLQRLFLRIQIVQEPRLANSVVYRAYFVYKFITVIRIIRIIRILFRGAVFSFSFFHVRAPQQDCPRKIVTTPTPISRVKFCTFQRWNIQLSSVVNGQKCFLHS